MSDFTAIPHDPTGGFDWDGFVDRSFNGTLFHRLDFLAYHGNRFAGREHPLVIRKGREPFAVMPLAAVDQDRVREGKSPYGGSYGGPAFVRRPSYEDSRRVIEAIKAYLSGHGMGRLTLTPPIQCCQEVGCLVFSFCLLEAGFVSVNRDLSQVVDLHQGATIEDLVTSRARNMVRKAIKSGVRIERRAPLADFWPTLEATYEVFGKRPTHTREEFEWLMRRLPDHVWVNVAYLDQKPVAGIGVFRINSGVSSAFYLSADPAYRQTQAQSLVVLDALAQAREAGSTWFDLGTSSQNMVARSQLFLYKSSFGAVGMFRETFVWEPGPK